MYVVRNVRLQKSKCRLQTWVSHRECGHSIAVQLAWSHGCVSKPSVLPTQTDYIDSHTTVMRRHAVYVFGREYLIQGILRFGKRF